MNNILVNLSIISKIKPNDKIYISSDNFVSIEHESFLQGILRFIYKNSREKNINNLNNFYSMVYVYIDELINSKYISFDNNKKSVKNILNVVNNASDENYLTTYNNIKEIHKYIKASINGLENLKKTYSPDIVTVSKIDITINNINAYIKKMEMKIELLDSI